MLRSAMVRGSVLVSIVVMAVLAGNRLSRAVPPPTQGTCTNTTPCTSFNPVQSGDCIAFANKNCNFSNSGDSVIWCDTTGVRLCQWYSPMQMNPCNGYCDGDPSRTTVCTWKTQKCSNP
jgi:hypothetical protein